ncbi:MAG: hypothetical protein DYH08_16780 [Actinobacteria bacterium ATB1]|nr:hypothetical protein [Actinobacteria bacterium ATB1]
MIRLVLCDAGGTLIAPRPSWEHHFVEVCAQAGVDVPEDEVFAIFHREMARFGRRVSETDARAFSLDEALSRQFWYRLYTQVLSELSVDEPGELPSMLYRRFTEFETYGLLEHAADAVRSVVETGRLAGLLSNWEAWLADLVDHLDLGDLFATVVVSGRVGVEKPDPAIYQMALEAAGVEADIGAVGDAVEKADGIRGAGIGDAARHHTVAEQDVLHKLVNRVLGLANDELCAGAPGGKHKGQGDKGLFEMVGYWHRVMYLVGAMFWLINTLY